MVSDTSFRSDAFNIRFGALPGYATSTLPACHLLSPVLAAVCLRPPLFSTPQKQHIELQASHWDALLLRRLQLLVSLAQKQQQLQPDGNAAPPAAQPEVKQEPKQEQQPQQPGSSAAAGSSGAAAGSAGPVPAPPAAAAAAAPAARSCPVGVAYYDPSAALKTAGLAWPGVLQGAGKKTLTYLVIGLLLHRPTCLAS